MNYRIGKWYPSKERVRSDFGEYWKGILLKGNRTAIIFNYIGARRVHYGDSFDPTTGTIQYVGEGKTGDQLFNSRNERLSDLKGKGPAVDVFLDCGDIFNPKHLLYAGKWQVDEVDYRSIDDRKVYLFTLSPHSQKVIEFLRFTFFDTEHQQFEKSVSEFARVRAAMYQDFPEVLRVRDNVVGEIGEYFAVKALNNKEANPVIRLSSGLKNIDAVQIKNGRTYAVKTVGKIPQTTSNIWSAKPEEAVDDFVIVLIDHDTLQPTCVMRMSAKKAARHLKKDTYQGSKKLAVTIDFVNEAEMLMGKRPTK
ncbi:hypothetical protein ID144_04305 [Pseudomonas sp. JM0905a]|uniref:hypothetical protein n=1 Tax=Pseudomonas sp. JM0905a TaxID=2772484 RepID=UPI001686B41F|nr:hypothetical protein [Pseudomonas sp. JM0905a]MBD2836261.1 hypothetical protein [Pseudomonas sp. JM0905a]